MGSRRRSAVVAAAALAAGLVTLAPTPARSNLLAAGAPSAAEPIELGHIPKCLEAVPAALGLGGTTVRLDALVLLDGVGQARAGEVMEVAATSYAPLGVALAPSYRAVSLTGTSASGLIGQAKSLLGGERPQGTDVVHVLTAKDITEGSDSVAGLADCIGGVAFADRAFSVSEVAAGADTSRLLGLTTSGHVAAKLAAHEIGHLMGGHHHYANCVEGVASGGGDLAPCTLMFNAVNLAALNFSTLNAAVVRGHAEAYAIP